MQLLSVIPSAPPAMAVHRHVAPEPGLAAHGIACGRWPLSQVAVSTTPQLAYARELLALQRRFGIAMIDRVKGRPGPTQRRADRAWQESDELHVHDDLELRVVLRGRLRFLVRSGHAGGWLAIDCEAGDWVALPAGLPHTVVVDAELDMLRLFSRPSGWRAQPAQPAAVAPQECWPLAA
jgi:1,2-dihydroxy-3-keto-5-methylthiopentene dioxygenase